MLIRFSAEVAVRYGLNEAILLEHIADRIRDAEPETHDDCACIDGRRWVRASAEDLADSLPFMSVGSIRRAVKSLQDSGLITGGKVSGHPYDRANWYALTGLGEQAVIAADE